MMVLGDEHTKRGTWVPTPSSAGVRRMDWVNRPFLPWMMMVKTEEEEESGGLGFLGPAPLLVSNVSLSTTPLGWGEPIIQNKLFKLGNLESITDLVLV